MNKPKIFIGIPNIGNIRTELVNWLLSLTKTDYRYSLFMPQNKPHDYNRNVIANRFLETNCDYLLMIDSDVVPTNNVLDMYKLDNDIVSAFVRTYKDGYPIPVALKKVEGGYKVDKEITKGDNIVDVVGTGCIMIKRKVFADLTQPYFKFVYDDKGFLTNGEDFDFCDRVRELGYDIHFNTDYTAQHFTTVNI